MSTATTVSPAPVLAPTRREPLALMEAIRREPMVTRCYSSYTRTAIGTPAGIAVAIEARELSAQPADQKPADRLLVTDSGTVYLAGWEWHADATEANGGAWTEADEIDLGHVRGRKVEQKCPEDLLEELYELQEVWARGQDSVSMDDLNMELNAGYRGSRGV